MLKILYIDNTSSTLRHIEWFLFADLVLVNFRIKKYFQNTISTILGGRNLVYWSCRGSVIAAKEIVIYNEEIIMNYSGCGALGPFPLFQNVQTPHKIT